MLMNYNMEESIKILNNKMQMELDKLNIRVLELQIEQLETKKDITNIKRILEILINKYKLYSHIINEW
jgi:hypothetical protein